MTDNRMGWVSDRSANPLDAEYDMWTGDPTTDRAAWLARALEANRRWDVLYGDAKEPQNEVAEEVQAPAQKARRRWLRRRPK